MRWARRKALCAEQMLRKLAGRANSDSNSALSTSPISTILPHINSSSNIKAQAQGSPRKQPHPTTTTVTCTRKRLWLRVASLYGLRLAAFVYTSKFQPNPIELALLPSYQSFADKENSICSSAQHLPLAMSLDHNGYKWHVVTKKIKSLNMKGCSRSFAKSKSSSRITGTMWSRDSSRFLRLHPANLKYGRMEASQSKCSRSFVKFKSSSRIKGTMRSRDMFSVSTMDSNLIDVYSSYMRFIGSEPNMRTLTQSQDHNSGFKPRLK